MDGEEIKPAIAKYLWLHKNIRSLENKLLESRSNFYLEHSFIGVAQTGNNPNDYQHALNPEKATLLIVTHEQTLANRLEANRKRLKFFHEMVDQQDIITLYQSQYNSHISHLEREVYDCIQEIEFYLESHLKARYERLTGKEYASDIHEIEEEENSLMERLKLIV